MAGRAFRGTIGRWRLWRQRRERLQAWRRRPTRSIGHRSSCLRRWSRAILETAAVLAALGLPTSLTQTWSRRHSACYWRRSYLQLAYDWRWLILREVGGAHFLGVLRGRARRGPASA